MVWQLAVASFGYLVRHLVSESETMTAPHPRAVDIPNHRLFRSRDGIAVTTFIPGIALA